MGRTYAGHRFDRTTTTFRSNLQTSLTGVYRASNGSDYVWGYPVDRARQCMWLGPVQHTSAPRYFTDYLSDGSSLVGDQCAYGQGAKSDFLQNAYNFAAATEFNCDHTEATRARGPSWTRMKSGTAFYYNLDWKSSYSGADTATDRSLPDLAAGEPVQYRYTTKDFKWSVIFVPGRGWGFVAANTVPHVKGYWSYEGNTQFVAECGDPNDPAIPGKTIPPVMASSDWSGDGRTDLLARRPDGTLSYYRGDGAGGFIGGEQQFNAGWDIYRGLLSPGDWTGDGVSDVLATDASGNIWLYRGNGAGGFTGSRQWLGDGFNSFDMLTAGLDFSGDGEPDVIARKPDGTLWMYRGNGAGGWITGNGDQIADGFDRFDALIGVRNFDNNSRTGDLIARKPDGTLWLFRGDGNWGFIDGNGTQIGTSSGWGPAYYNFLGGGLDFSGDGYADLLAREHDGDIRLYRGNGTAFTGGQVFNSGWNIFDRLMMVG